MHVPGWIMNLKRPGSLWGTLVGWVCICVGVLGLVLPVIPGIPLLVAGLFILSARYRWASVSLHWLGRWVTKISSRKAPHKQEVSELVTINRG
jgi:uncharacterized membrane protein YbaN (DUF454 family)